MKHRHVAPQVPLMYAGGQSFKTFTGETTEVAIQQESTKVAVPKPPGGPAITQFHQNVLLVHFTNQALCHAEEVRLVNEWRKNKLVNPGHGVKSARIDQIDNPGTFPVSGSKQAKQRYDFF